MGTRILPSVLGCAVAMVLCGCRMGVPIHVWQPAKLESAVGKRVVLSNLGGPDDIASQVQTQLVAQIAREENLRVDLVSSDDLQRSTQVQLVSHDGQPNDLALASVARRSGFDYVLRGETVHSRSAADRKGNVLRMSWQLTSVADDRPAGGAPVMVDLESATEQFPDLAILTDEQYVIATAAARNAMQLITPWVDRQRVQLAIPYLQPGSETVRQGNAAALAGRWPQAMELWREAADQSPMQTAAIHNLAIAAAAKQDFSTAKQLIRTAIRRHPSKLYKQNLVWIERNQRLYHEAFGLEDPPEGWYVTSR